MSTHFLKKFLNDKKRFVCYNENTRKYKEGENRMEDKKTKEKYIHVRIEGEFKEEVQKVAKSNGLTLSTLISMLLHEWYQKKVQ